MQTIQDPSQVVNDQMQRARNYMEPAFNRQMEEQMGHIQAGLGNKYMSTFGQLTAGREAQNEGIARAQLESNIYGEGQKLYDQLVGRGNVLAGISNTGAQGYQNAANAFVQPYEGLGNALKTGAASVSSANQNLIDLYNAQLGGAGHIAGQNQVTYGSTPTLAQTLFNNGVNLVSAIRGGGGLNVNSYNSASPHD